MTLIELVGAVVVFSIGSFCFTFPHPHAFALALTLGATVAACYAFASILVGLLWRRLPAQPKGVEAALTRMLFATVYCVLLFSLVPHPSLLGWPALALLFLGLSKWRWRQVALGAFGVLLAVAVVLHFSRRASPNQAASGTGARGVAVHAERLARAVPEQQWWALRPGETPST